MPSDPPVLLGPDLRGRVLDQRYRLDAVLGCGGTANVYAAADLRLGGHGVAVKVFHPEAARSEEQRRRIRLEALVGARLDHPHLVSVLDFGAMSSAGVEPQPYLVMPRVEGPTLRELVLGGPIPWRRVVALGVQILDAVAAIHGLGVLHRDLKSNNCVVSRRGGRDHVVLLDLGLAKVGGFAAGLVSAVPRTRTGAIFGTLAYLAPEQACGQVVDARADLYAVGVILFEALTRRLPFVGGEYAVLRGHVEEVPPSPGSVAPGAGIPAELDAAVLRALAKDPGERFASAEAFAGALAAIVDAEEDARDRRTSDDRGDDAARRALAAWTRFEYAGAREAAAEAALRSRSWSPLPLLLELLPE
ncbi:MAG TPA: serine/threonine-protein kinase [Nannocystaceae bacterium]|nr:serine/threonine-protein kinase [Nannocystaceae bacterium]